MSDTDKPEGAPIPGQAPAAPAAPPPAGPPPNLHALDKESLDREVEAAMGGLSNMDIYGDLSARQPKPKPIPGAKDDGKKKGRVVQVRGNDIFVEVPGGRTQGVMASTQFPEGAPAVGTELEFYIDGYDPANGLLRLQRKGAAQHTDWSSVAVGMTVEARVTATNKGGLSVDVNGIRAFLPISQIDLYRIENADQFLNQRLLCEVTEVDPAARNLVVSRRVLLEREREESKEKLWQEIAEGQVREGIVRSVKEFGAFIDLGGLDGLLHISEMSWSRVADASTVVQPGQKLKVVVLKIDREKRKISLGLKQLLASPWDDAVQNYLPGNVVPGKVTRLMDFGAFVELEPGVEGLIHISELSPQRIRRVADVVTVGQEVQVKVLTVDTAQRRIALSLKGALPPEPEAPAEEEVEEVVEQKPPRPRTTPLRGGIGDTSR